MIKHVLNTIKNQLNDYIKLKDPDFLGGTSDIVVVSNIVDQEGKLAINTSGHNQSDHVVIITLVNTEEETNYKDQNYFRKAPDDTIQKQNPDIRVNLNVLFSCYSETYDVSLSLLGYVITFFQNKNAFDSKNSPQLTPGTRFTTELLSLSMEQNNHLWGYLGAKYLPSVVYKIRMLTFQEGLIKGEGLPIMEINEDFKDSTA